MTILEALKSVVSYPVSSNTVEAISITRGLTSSATFDQSVALSSAFELAKADVYAHVVGAANISEGGYSVSMTDKSNMIKMASAIYAKHGESNPFAVTLTNASNRW